MLRLLDGLKMGHKVALQADTDRLLKFSQAAERLKKGQTAFGVPELAYFNNWREVQDYSETSEGSDLKTWVKLVEEHGTNTLNDAIASLSDSQSADYIISTAHKPKVWSGSACKSTMIFCTMLRGKRSKSALRSCVCCMLLVRALSSI